MVKQLISISYAVTKKDEIIASLSHYISHIFKRINKNVIKNWLDWK